MGTRNLRGYTYHRGYPGNPLPRGEPPQDVLHFPVTRFESVWETETTAMAGRHRGMGHVDRYKSMGVAIQKKARGYGDGGCGGMQPIPFRNRRLPCLMATGMVFTNARPSMALTFSVELMLGTSPLAFACPADEASPLSASTPRSPPPNKGTNEALAQLGKTTLLGWVIGRDGSLATHTCVIPKRRRRRQNTSPFPMSGSKGEMEGDKGYVFYCAQPWREYLPQRTFPG